MMNKSFLLAGFAALANAAAQAPPAPPFSGYTGPGGNATIQSNLPVATYTAVLPATNFNNRTGSTITGSITGKTSGNGTGVVFTVNFQGFPDVATYGPFIYHVHASNITNGNCTTALAHLDPTQRGETYSCVSEFPETCQAGDLSGKHGNITTTSFQTTYTDLYLSTDPTSPYFFGSKSVVVHARNTTRLTCANFVLGTGNGTSTSGGNSTSGGSGTGSGNGTSTTPRPSSSSGASGSSGAATAFDAGRIGLYAIISVVFFMLL